MARKKITISRQSAGHVLLQILDIFLPGADTPQSGLHLLILPRGEVSSGYGPPCHRRSVSSVIYDTCHTRFTSTAQNLICYSWCSAMD